MLHVHPTAPWLAAASLALAACATTPPLEPPPRPANVAVSAAQPEGHTMNACLVEHASGQTKDLWRGAGDLVVRFTIAANGSVTDLEVVRPELTDKELRLGLAEAARKCPWIPAKDHQGHPVAQPALLPLSLPRTLLK